MDEFGARVLELQPLVESEVKRLVRLGVTLEEEDAVQEGMKILLEHRGQLESVGDKALVRAILRRRLINVFVVRPVAKKRKGRMVSLSDLMSSDLDTESDNGEAGQSSYTSDPVPHDVLMQKLTEPSHESLIVNGVEKPSVVVRHAANDDGKKAQEAA